MEKIVVWFGRFYSFIVRLINKTKRTPRGRYVKVSGDIPYAWAGGGKLKLEEIRFGLAGTDGEDKDHIGLVFLKQNCLTGCYKKVTVHLLDQNWSTGFEPIYTLTGNQIEFTYEIIFPEGWKLGEQ